MDSGAGVWRAGVATILSFLDSEAPEIARQGTSNRAAFLQDREVESKTHNFDIVSPSESRHG